ncbi:MAG: DUF1963 domain-containing protein [Flavobacteriales bacterium]|jgi:uncharacterized protein YwqG|nr:DUF1963 domain-containing protein [Flavobacteriales bacterium]
MKNTIFNFNAPPNFEPTVDTSIKIRLTNHSEQFDHQPPFIDISLNKIEHIKTQKGANFLEQYITWTEGFQTQVISSRIIEFDAYKTYIVETHTNAFFQDNHFKINYFNACLILDETWCLEFQFVYETKNTAKYQAICEATFQSLTVMGDASVWSSSFEQAVLETQQSYETAFSQQEEKQPLDIPSFQIPKDGKEFIQIDEFEFTFIEESCYWHTVDFSHKLYIQIKAKAIDIEAAKACELLEYGYELEDGEIQLSFDSNKIFQHGIPTGEFTFEDGKSGAPHYLHFRNKGIGYDFYGTTTLQNGWLGINGLFKKSYQDEPTFKIKCYIQLDPSKINWISYQFTLKEALQAAPDQVEYLWINNWTKASFPKEILLFKNLKKLTIHSPSNHAKETVEALTEIDDAIGNLSQLTELHISNTSIQHLPESIGKLKLLERIHISNNQITTLPKSIVTLPNLKYLWASRNQIQTVPEKIELAQIINIDLSNNQLKTLPESLATQPLLKTINIDNNPLTNLPDTYNNIELELNIDAKRRLLNYDYLGADRKGTVSWENTSFLAQHDTQLSHQFKQAIQGTVLEKHQKALELLALKAVCINTTEADNYSQIGNTRFGGLPDLPLGENYPSWHYQYDEETTDYHLIFIGQLNCEELAPYQDYLPRTGMLYFYLQDEESFNCKVIYHPKHELQSALNLKEQELTFYDSIEPYHPFRVKLSSFVALPSFYSDEYWYQFVNAPELNNLEDYNHEDHKAFTEEVRTQLAKALGKTGVYRAWNNCYYQDEHHSINDYVFTQHESPQEQAALKHKGNPEDWVLLLKVCSDNNTGFCFWDAGELFFVIHKSDLAKMDFSNVYACIESS